MKRVLMFVYNDLNTDARVQRAAEALSEIVDLEVLSVGNEYSSKKYRTANIKSLANSNVAKYFDIFRKIVKWMKGKKYDVLYAHDFSSALPALYIKAFKKCDKIIYDAHELYIPERGTTFSLRDRFFYWFERKLIKKADLIICAQEKRGEVMVNHYRLQSKPITIKNISKLPQAVGKFDMELQRNCDDFFKKKGITIVYAGGLVPDRKLDELISNVSELGEGYKLLFVGGGSDQERLKSIAQKYPFLTCCFLGSVPYIQLSKILERCDVGYLFYPVDILNNIYCASNKIYEYASINLPMVANPNPTVQEVFIKWEIGICGDRIKDSIRAVVAEIDKYKSNCTVFDRENSWESEATLLRQVIQGFLNNGEKINKYE